MPVEAERGARGSIFPEPAPFCERREQKIRKLGTAHAELWRRAMSRERARLRATTIRLREGPIFVIFCESARKMQNLAPRELARAKFPFLRASASGKNYARSRARLPCDSRACFSPR